MSAADISSLKVLATGEVFIYVPVIAVIAVIVLRIVNKVID